MARRVAVGFQGESRLPSSSVSRSRFSGTVHDAVDASRSVAEWGKLAALRAGFAACGSDLCDAGGGRLRLLFRTSTNISEGDCPGRNTGCDLHRDAVFRSGSVASQGVVSRGPDRAAAVDAGACGLSRDVFSVRRLCLWNRSPDLFWSITANTTAQVERPVAQNPRAYHLLPGLHRNYNDRKSSRDSGR